MTESTDAKNQFAYTYELIRCHSCAASARTVEKFVKEDGDQSGLMARKTGGPD